MNEQQTEKPTCSKCGRAVEIVAKGLCRRCYDQQRKRTRKNDPLHNVAGTKGLSTTARALLVQAIEHRRSTGKLGCLDDLRAGMGEITQGQVLAAARECMASGAGCYGFMPIQRKPSKIATRSSAESA